MEKEDFIQPSVEKVLNEINFIRSYEDLSGSFSKRDEDFKYSNDEIINIAKKAGCNLKYSKSKEFYFEEKCDDYSFGFGFTIRFHSLELGCSIKNENLGIDTSAPWGFLVKLMSDNTIKVKKPMFSSYKDLEGVLFKAIEIYGSIKDKVLLIQ